MPIYKSTLNTDQKNQNKKPKTTKSKTKMPLEKKKKIICLSFLLFSLLCFVLLLFKNPIKSFLLGMFGIFAFPMFLAVSFLCLVRSSNKKYFVNKRYIVCLCFSLFFIITIVHLILTRNVSISGYGTYLTQTYKTQTSGGGLLLSLFSYFCVKYLTVVGAYVLTIIGLIISIGFTIDCIVVARNTEQKIESKFNFSEFKTLNENTNDVTITFEHKQEDLKRKIAKQKLGIEKTESSIISSSMHIDNIVDKLPKSRPMSNKEYILTPPEIVIPDYSTKKSSTPPITTKPINNIHTDDVIVSDVEDFYNDAKIIEGKTTIIPETQSSIADNKTNNSFDTKYNIDNDFENVISKEQDVKDDITNETQSIEIDKDDNYDFAQENDNADNDFIDEYKDIDETIEEDVESTDTDIPSIPKSSSNEYDIPIKSTTIPFGTDIESKEIKPIKTFDNPTNTLTKTIIEDEKPNPLGRPKKQYAPYVKPPVDLLNYIENIDIVTDEECNENIEKLEKVLDDFKIPAKVKAVQVGPAVTRYEIGMPTGISVKKVQMHSDDIAMALASNGSIRIEAPIPGKNAVGIEVPNKKITAVSLREMIESLDYQKRVNPMSFVLGKDINGAIQFCNLDKMPHLLVAGSTGSGKSVCLNTMIISMLYKSSPEDIRLILIDPKTVEFSVYANLPHLLTPHIITTKEQTINALNWAIKEMEYRYTLLQQNEVVNIKEYNNLPIVKDGIVEKLPYIVIVIDELNDLMLETKREMEERIMKLAQKSRAAGIHLVIATQRPSVDVITGTIKANLPSRIAFALTNFADSKTVLDMSGAEKLLGRGDMLFKPNDMPEPRRVQGAYITSPEVSAVVKFIKANNPTDYDAGTTKEITTTETEHSTQSNNNTNSSNNFDPVLKDALKWFISANQASITMIQRRFGVGYARAARIVDQMEQNGFISSQDGSKPRQVLISLDEFNKLFPN